MVNVVVALVAAVLSYLAAGASGASTCFKPAAVGGHCAGDEMLCFDSSEVGIAGGADPKAVRALLELVARVEQLEAQIASVGLGARKKTAKAANALKALNKERSESVSQVSKALAQLSWSPASGSCQDMDYCKSGTLLATQDGADFLNMQCSRDAPGQDDFCSVGCSAIGSARGTPRVRDREVPSSVQGHCTTRAEDTCRARRHEPGNGLCRVS